MTALSLTTAVPSHIMINATLGVKFTIVMSGAVGGPAIGKKGQDHVVMETEHPVYPCNESGMM